ncbi:hypothetical protein IE81DRAFT_331874 [Ceraceosorus guamensis]|uniref:Uncharacterized protein n=1 Tax=Ceraceosorus guamensis TaxID=1522189 RepID=A0A316VRF2_9BASI|nr:hypothetical protein IE81DRAFT_331874 [Ceraceosorus guamensis]PWN40092.1 hypothetical protein IE81DRAFT_331874 [Ceraceosorus guamensis]
MQAPADCHLCELLVCLDSLLLDKGLVFLTLIGEVVAITAATPELPPTPKQTTKFTRLSMIISKPQLEPVDVQRHNNDCCPTAIALHHAQLVFSAAAFTALGALTCSLCRRSIICKDKPRYLFLCSLSEESWAGVKCYTSIKVDKKSVPYETELAASASHQVGLVINQMFWVKQAQKIAEEDSAGAEGQEEEDDVSDSKLQRISRSPTFKRSSMALTSSSPSKRVRKEEPTNKLLRCAKIASQRGKKDLIDVFLEEAAKQYKACMKDGGKLERRKLVNKEQAFLTKLMEEMGEEGPLFESLGELYDHVLLGKEAYMLIFGGQGTFKPSMCLDIICGHIKHLVDCYWAFEQTLSDLGQSLQLAVSTGNATSIGILHHNLSIIDHEMSSAPWTELLIEMHHSKLMGSPNLLKTAGTDVKKISKDLDNKHQDSLQYKNSSSHELLTVLKLMLLMPAPPTP